MINLELTQQFFQIIIEQLSAGPYRVVAPVLADLQRQITQAQVAAQRAQPLQGQTQAAGLNPTPPNISGEE